MKNLYFSAIILGALNIALSQETPVSPVQTGTTQTVPTATTTPTTSPVTNNTQPATTPSPMPLSLGGITQSDNTALLNLLNSQTNLTDLAGKKVDDTQQRLIKARFEKYLNSPAATSKEDLAYNKLLENISMRLAGKGGGSDSIRVLEAWRMLFDAENYPLDDQLCRTIADKVINFWQTSKKIRQLLQENADLEQDRTIKESRIRSVANADRQEFITIMRGKDATPPPTREYELDPIKKRLSETEAKLQENKSYEATSKINQKLDFQSLIVQFFVQRRYYHAMITNDFYRYLFAAEDAKLEGLDSLKSQVFGGVDIKLTTATIDALCREAINDTNRAVEAIKFLISKGELHTATQRLLEAFYIGEHLAPIKTFPIESKREIMRYMRDTEKLINAIKVKHVERAETVLKEIKSYVKDFDSGQVEAFIQTSQQLSNLALQKALVAAQTQNQTGVETALKEAVEFWPTNPKIQEFLKSMVSRVDLKDVASTDFDRLLAQKDFRGIFNDRFRYAAALAMDPTRNQKFLDIMKRMEVIEASMKQAEQLVRLNNNFAAWEIIEKVYRQFPEDANLNRLRADLTLKASKFAAAIALAEDAKNKGNNWIALLEYLKARKIYPMSTIANDEIVALANRILQ